MNEIISLLEQIRDGVRAANDIVVGTPEACRRLNIGWEQLDRLVDEGRIKRVPDLRGRGGSHQYAVTELERFATADITGHLRAVS